MNEKKTKTKTPPCSWSHVPLYAPEPEQSKPTTRRELRALLREALPLLMVGSGAELRKKIRATLKRGRKARAKCQGCGSSSWLRERAGEMLCTSCYLLNEHLEKEPLCGACLLSRCRFQNGDPLSSEEDAYQARPCRHNRADDRCIKHEKHEGPHLYETDALRERAHEIAAWIEEGWLENGRLDPKTAPRMLAKLVQLLIEHPVKS